jgi:hypothetical protein
MSEQELTDQQIAEAVYGYAAERMHAGQDSMQIKMELMQKGLDAQTADTVVDGLFQARSSAARGAGMRNMAFGSLWCIGGTVVTVVTLSMAANGGTYVVAWGAIVFGALQFLRGLWQTAVGK